MLRVEGGNFTSKRLGELAGIDGNTQESTEMFVSTGFVQDCRLAAPP